MNKTNTNSYIFSVGSTFTNNNYIDVTSLYLNDNKYYEIHIYDKEVQGKVVRFTLQPCFRLTKNDCPSRCRMGQSGITLK